jgi:hypothetical protein
MQQTAHELKQLGEHFPALDRNITRILASLKMLQINISDAVEMGLIEQRETER